MTQEERFDIVYDTVERMQDEVNDTPFDVLKQALIRSIHWFGIKVNYYDNILLKGLFILYSLMACVLMLPIDLLLCGRYIRVYFEARKLGYDESFIQWQKDLIDFIND